ncbi:TVP38/TMEM64 family protein [Desertibacillus haloalkaliphilus]|uniref:TVP38/TMEM64 family protein n=1 Tax=Desertibacillus haloalkaliphilus TaxID=1328930 RepID=UPI001C26A40A|nr:VTT domain-containing protein [Desertibacillus haloalkaliphilus]MBU8905130.1 VTT domain-containing protein [Desertibacillus haloalkaliphilus]
MEHSFDSILLFIEGSGWMAPIFFILLHVFRQFLFIPVVFICLLGGYLFGVIPGTIYSLIGLTVMSVVFYSFVHAFPTWLNKLSAMQQKWLGERESLNIAQLMILRTMPFIHFHLVSLYLIEITDNVKEYTRLSFLASIPPAFLYTAFGHIISEMPLSVGLMLLAILLTLFYIVGRKDTIYKWNEFFSIRST